MKIINMEITTVIYITLGLVAYVYWYFKSKFRYWEEMGVQYIKPRIPLGNIQGWKPRYSSAEWIQKFYNHFKELKERFGGFYFFTKPAIILLDLDLVKCILVRDFECFQGRGIYFNEQDDPLSANLFALEGRKWKILRAKLTPTFTTGRMKIMFPTIVEVGNELKTTLRTMISTQKEVDVKELLSRFTTDVIGTCAFGIECNSLKDPNSYFHQMGKKVFEVPRKTVIKQSFGFTFNDIANLLKLKVVNNEVSKFFMGIVRETVGYREEHNVHRNDFMDLLLQLKRSGRLLGDEPSEITGGNLTIDEIAAQAFVFFLAGSETTSTMLTYCLYELALNQNIQDRARQIINEVLHRHGSFTYEAMSEMTYIDHIINESLRKYPPGGVIFRTATRDYIFPRTLGKSGLNKGCVVLIPVYAIHHDPDIYPDPEVFDPERFIPEAVARRHPQAFLPFGDGPKNCIGFRFGMMQARIGLVTLLSQFRFTLSSRTNVPLTFAKNSLILSPDSEVWLNVEQI